MHLFKFKFLVIALLFSPLALSFTGNECLNTDFQVNISHKGKPFGLSKVVLDVSKEGCTIKVRHEKFKYLKSAWSIDVCREPIHIKKNGGSDVLKKITKCDAKSSDDFCVNTEKLLTVIQDDGLIFAQGEKEKIDSHHGKSYCGYLLLKQYLQESRVFNRGQDYSALFKNGYQDEGTKPADSIISAPVAPRPQVEGLESKEGVQETRESSPVIEKEKEANGVGTF